MRLLCVCMGHFFAGAALELNVAQGYRVCLWQVLEDAE